jgi:hypothetical protein
MTRRDLSKAALLALGTGLTRRSFAQNTGAQKTEKLEPVTAYAADFILKTRYEDLPAEVIELARKSILDGLGLALCGSAAKSGEIVRQYLKSLGVTGSANGATVIGSSLKAPVRFAAFANAVGIHADDYDDTQLAVAEDRVYGLLTHPTAPALPGALALAETKSMSGKQLMLAYNIGVELECKIAEAIAPRHYEDGFHTTGTVGVFGSAASAAKLLGFDRARVLTTLGIAASEGAGLRENFGTMRRLRLHRDHGEAGEAVDLRLPGRLDQAVSFGVAEPSRHDRDGAPAQRAPLHRGSGGADRGGRQQEQRQRPDSPPAQDQPGREIQHGVLHGCAGALQQSRVARIYG